jgi:hypothetical protein
MISDRQILRKSCYHSRQGVFEYFVCGALPDFFTCASLSSVDLGEEKDTHTYN